MNGAHPWTSVPGSACSNLGLVAREMNGSVPKSTTNSSGPSIGVSSLVTDTNSSLSGGAQLQPSTSMNGDFMRVPASPMSFSSNNTSGSSVIDGSIMQQSPPQEQVQKRRSSSVSSQAVIDAGGALHAQKKSRIDASQGDIVQQQLIQQLVHGQNSLHFQGQQNPQLQALIHQHKLAQLQQQHLLQPFSQIQQPQVGIPRQPQLRPPLAQPGMQLGGPVRTPVENAICSRRIKQYLFHKRHRPENNSIIYWRKLVEEYFAPQSRERWCVSSYENRGNSSAASPQKALDSWRCDICNTHGGKGYDATYEVLPRLFQIRFDHGVIDECLFLDSPNEFRLSNGQMVLEYAKVVQKSVYEHLHVIHEGHLRIIFSPELKIMSWEFCSRRHEEYTTRKTIAPQVNNLLQVAQNYQTAVSESGPAGISNNDAQTICNMFVTASRQLAKNLEHHTLNEHGLSKRYVRCLQISEVVNHMKDLIEFSHKNNLGPKESLNSYSKTIAKFQNMPRQLMASASLANNQSSTRVMGVQQETSAPVNNQTPSVGAIGNNTLQTATALNSYQNILRSSSANQILLQQEASSIFKGPAAMHNGIQLEAGAPPAGTGPSNVINNNTASIVPSRNNSFKSVSSNPSAAATGGNAVNQKVDESFHELEDLDHLITSELLESGLFGAGKGGDVLPW
ncbi:putative transcriptional regulator SLK3 [Panicum miliaceum]|uniref:Transcriptional regulator SLK3 n=1 Tax=Panicum miliaceum TaxID=4540 RepID=A0A3L6RZ12_PANMI|nr:putative transcriptional regulator SLK3 [Panicum miliaceum]